MSLFRGCGSIWEERCIGDEFCLRPCKYGQGCVSKRLRRRDKNSGANHGQRSHGRRQEELTSHLIGVPNAGSRWLFQGLFCACVAQESVRVASFSGRCTDPTSSSSAFSLVVRNVIFQNKRCFGRKWLPIAPLSPSLPPSAQKKVCMMRPHGADRASAKPELQVRASPDARIISHHAQLQCCEGSLLEDSINWFAALVCKARDLYGLHRRTVSREALHCPPC